MKKILKIILFIIQGVLVFIVYGALTTASVKNIEKIILVEQFKNKAVYQEQLSTNTLKFYKVESNEQMPAFIKQNVEIVNILLYLMFYIYNCFLIFLLVYMYKFQY